MPKTRTITEENFQEIYQYLPPDAQQVVDDIKSLGLEPEPQDPEDEQLHNEYREALHSQAAEVVENLRKTSGKDNLQAGRLRVELKPTMLVNMGELSLQHAINSREAPESNSIFVSNRIANWLTGSGEIELQDEGNYLLGDITGLSGIRQIDSWLKASSHEVIMKKIQDRIRGSLSLDESGENASTHNFETKKSDQSGDEFTPIKVRSIDPKGVKDDTTRALVLRSQKDGKPMFLISDVVRHDVFDRVIQPILK